MSTHSSTPDTPLLSSDFSHQDRTLWFGHIALHKDRISLTGWTWSGRIHETIDLNEVHKVETWSVRQGPNVVVHTNGSTRLRGRIETGIGLWHWTLKNDTDIEVVARS